MRGKQAKDSALEADGLRLKIFILALIEPNFRSAADNLHSPLHIHRMIVPKWDQPDQHPYKQQHRLFARKCRLHLHFCC
jgi:hypothetical protein